jgi:putative membrane protein
LVGQLAKMSPNLSWTLSPGVLIGAALVAGIYLRRWWAVRTSGSPRAAAEAPVWRLCCFIGSVATALLALISPVDALADQLFFAHMIQHMLLLDAVPILAIVGLTKVILRPVTRAVHDLERRAGPLAHPAFAVLLYVAVIWAWHVPAAYDLAVTHPVVHVLEHMTFVIAGSLYWWHLLSPIRARMRLNGMGPIVYMGATKLLVGALGMGLAFAPVAEYSYYVHHARVWGISAIDDQSIAGLIMAVEQSLVMGVAIVVLFVRALTESERAQQRRERYELV